MVSRSDHRPRHMKPLPPHLVARWTVDQWKNVIFSDEKMFRLRLHKQIRCWKPVSANRFDAKFTIPSVGRVDGVMVWAAINGAGKICLIRCPPTINSMGYQQILQDAMPFIKPRCVPECRLVPLCLHLPTLQAAEVPVPTGWGISSPQRCYKGLDQGQVHPGV